jgi:3-methyl-2-oxobutanoate hydroxymethyltransferase
MGEFVFLFLYHQVRAKEEEEAKQLLKDAKMLERIGCFAVVLEKIPAKLAKEVAESVSIPVIGIGAGADVDGQVLVLHDMIGMTHEFNPRFLRRYMNLYETMTNSIGQYVSDVKSSHFPNAEEQY